MSGIVVVVVLLLVAFLDMKKRHVASRATRVVPSHAVGMDGAFFCHVSMTTPLASKSTLAVSFVAMSKARLLERGDVSKEIGRTASKLGSRSKRKKEREKKSPTNEA